MRVVLADGGGAGSRNRLLGFVERAGWEVVGEAIRWDGVPELVQSRSADLVLIGGDADFASGAHALDGTCASLVVIPDAQAAKEYVGTPAFALLPPDAEGDLINAMAELSLARARELHDARRQADHLRETLESRKIVERAKGVLMKRLEITEEAAYKRMQRASQEENRKMRDVAESILSAERLYGGASATEVPPTPG